MSHFYILVRQKEAGFFFHIYHCFGCGVRGGGAYLALGDKSNLRCHMERSLFPYLFKLLLRPLTFAEGSYYTTNNNTSICKSFYFVFQTWILKGMGYFKPKVMKTAIPL